MDSPESVRKLLDLLPATVVLVLVLIAHELLRTPHARLHALTVPLLMLPAAYYASVLGIPGAVLVVLLCALVIGDHVNDWHPTVVTIEIVLVAGVSAVAAVIGAMSNRESAALAAVDEASRQRLEELQGSGYWDRVSVTEIGLYSTRIESEFISRALARHKPGIVADVGSGSGRLHSAILPHTKLVIATEVSRSALRAMRPQPDVLPIVVGPTQESLPFKSGALRAVVAIEVPAASDTAWFREDCRRVLEPGGVVVLSIHNALSYKGIYSRLLSNTRARRGQSWAELYYRYGYSAHLRAWESAGFRPRASTGFYWLPFSRASNSSWVRPAAALEWIIGLRLLVGWSPWALVELEKRR